MYEVDEITKVYLKPPTIEQVFSFVEEVGVKYSHFENYYGMHKGILKNVKCGNKNIPKKHWWIFYERIVPQYGIYNNFKKPKSKSSTKLVPKKVPSQSEEIDNHGRLGRLKTK